jgi:two-component system NtrC family sensor kinase
MKILVVEDNEITRKLLRVTLRTASYDMLEAPDGRSALALAARERPDLVLQDLKLPDMDGVDLVRRLRELPGFADLPVLAVSGFISRMDEARAVGGLFDEFLVKPVQPSELIRVLEAHLPRSRAGATGPGAGRRVLLVDDEPVQLKALRAHLELDGFTVLTARDGIDALELIRSRPVDAILTDVMMPRLDGFGLCLTIREDKALANLPVVLFTRRYLDQEDEAVARQMGANAFVALGSSFVGIGKVVLAALQGEAPRPATTDSGELREKHVYRVISQLERQSRINAGLAQRCVAQSAAMSVLSTLSNALTKRFDTPLPTEEMLGACLEAGSFSLAALYLLDADGGLTLAGHRGYTEAPLGEVENLFGHEPLFRTALETASPIAVPSSAVDTAVAAEFLSRSGPASALVLPILFGDERLGILLVGTNFTELSADESLDFARTIAHQIGLVIQLRRAFTRVAAAEQQYREIFEHTVEGILRITPQGRLVLANPAMARIFGYDSAAQMVAAVSDIGRQLYVDPEQHETLLRLLSEQGSVFRFEVQMRRRDGSVIWVTHSGQTIREPGGRTLYYDGALEDITERRRAEAATTALASTARALLGSLDPAVLSELVTRNVCRLLNATVALVYRIEPESGDLIAMGASNDETRRHPWAARLPAGTGLTRLVLRARRPYTAPDVLLDPRANLPAEREADLVSLGDRAVLVVPLIVRDRVFGTLMIRDITGRRFEPAEIELAQAFADQAAIALDNAHLFEEAHAGRDFLASVTQNSADGILTTDADGRITFFSQGAQEIWGREEAAALGRPLAELMGSDPDEVARVLLRVRTSGPIRNYETVATRPPGRTIDLQVSFAPLRAPSGEVAGVVAVTRDVTERKRTEAALRQSEKLAAMSTLVAGVAHELNNPLEVIFAHSELLAFDAPSEVPQRAEKINRAAQRCARLVKNFLTLARQHPPERTRVSVSQIVRETAELMVYPLRVNGVTLALDLAPDLPLLWADPHQLQQVLLNLLTNAQYALRARPSPRTVALSVRVEGDDRIRIVIADNGPGVPPEISERIFEPFFTTKPVGEGTGLGLSLCQGLVESHGGTLTLDDAPGGGARFTIMLPLTGPAAMAPKGERPADLAAVSILVVDDEPEVADVLGDMLRRDGHRVDVVYNGREALERVQTATFDVIMSDLRMPEIDGPELYRLLEEMGHPLTRRFVVVTGDILGPETRAFIERSGVPALAKPLVFDDMRGVIRGLLARA